MGRAGCRARGAHRPVDGAAPGAATARARRHPVLDFLFTYYSESPGRLRRWHPGPDVALAGAAPHAGWRWYTQDADGTVRLDAAAFLADRGDTVRFVRRLLAATAERPAFSGCFGLHEWAMVYRDRETRHPVPLRLGQQGTDAVVEAHPIRCTHFDAFRFFTPDAVRPEPPAADPGEPARARAAGLPARRHGPLQVGVQAQPGHPG